MTGRKGAGVTTQWRLARRRAGRAARRLGFPAPRLLAVAFIAPSLALLLFGPVVLLILLALLVILLVLLGRVGVEIAACAGGACGGGPSAAFQLLQTLVLGLGGALTLYLLAKRADAMQRTAQANVEALNKRTEELRLTRRDHLSRRFSEAVKQLGDEKMAIRLGGIAALGAVGQETDSEADRRMVLDVLCAFVRTGRTRFADRDDTLGPAPEDMLAAVKTCGAIPCPQGYHRDLR
ncbi:hypothetical protein SAMN05421742_10942 [Roseospirillum parvum]|uniref:Uncharacterized protein n=1 Tax=Roseospirillum parvum TaxID=83401 RepID=A0A1G8E5J0_9PROT|nr:hypothetical protein SAMN05421742_10942 [Roseospirillum parvum]